MRNIIVHEHSHDVLILSFENVTVHCTCTCELQKRETFLRLDRKNTKKHRNKKLGTTLQRHEHVQLMLIGFHNTGCTSDWES